MNESIILEVFKSLDIAANDYKKICECYYIARLIASCLGRQTSGKMIMNNSKLQNMLAKEGVSIKAGEIEAYASLSNEISKNTDIFDFIEEFMPTVIADIFSFKKYTEAMHDSTKLRLLYAALDIGAGADAPIVPKNEKWEKIIHEYDNFPAIWYSVHYIGLSIPALSINRIVNEVSHFYASNYWPQAQILEDYSKMLLARSESERREAVFGSQMYVLSPNAYEHGLPERDKELYELLTKLCRIKPHKVIEQLFFGQGRIDLMAEQSLAGQIFASIVHEHDNALIVNPSPTFINFWSDFAIDIKTCMTVKDETLAKLYGYEYDHIDFQPFDTATEPKYENALIFCRNVKPYEITKELENVAVGANVLALIPETSVTSKNGDFLIPELKIKRILTVPTELSETAPRKKILIWATVVKEPEPDYNLQLVNCKADLDYAFVAPEKNYINLPYSALGKGYTLVQLRKRIADGSLTSRKKLQPASTYWLSPEIALSYTIRKKGNAYQGRVCYRKKLPANSKKQMGQMLTPYIEQGLRTSDPDLMGTMIEKLVLKNPHGIWSIIEQDTLKFYDNDLSDASLKTIWICTRGLLLNQNSYREDICIELFCGKSQELSNLHPKDATEEEYSNALQKVIGDKPATQYWKQLNVILRGAYTKGILPDNPESDIYKIPRKTARNRIQEVRDALIQRSFTTDEMKNIILFSTKMNEEEKNPRCISNSLYLAPLIRLFTGISNRELCALTWSKFVYEPECDIYQLIITHTVADDLHLIHVLDQNPNKMRCIPIVPYLADLLNKRMDFLCEKTKLDRTAIQNLPIILSNEKRKKNRCNPDKASQICRQAVQFARKDKLPSMITLPDCDREVDIDLNSYSGDIFAANLKYCLKNISKFTAGELAYILGIAPPDTYSAHYADYTDCIYQKIMFVKLKRWLSMLMLPRDSRLIQVRTDGTMEKELTSSADGVISANYVLKANQEGALDNASVHIECPHGMEITVIIL